MSRYVVTDAGDPTGNNFGGVLEMKPDQGVRKRERQKTNDFSRTLALKTKWDGEGKAGRAEREAKWRRRLVFHSKLDNRCREQEDDSASATRTALATCHCALGPYTLQPPRSLCEARASLVLAFGGGTETD